MADLRVITISTAKGYVFQIVDGEEIVYRGSVVFATKELAIRAGLARIARGIVEG